MIGFIFLLLQKKGLTSQKFSIEFFSSVLFPLWKFLEMVLEMGAAKNFNTVSYK